MAGHWPHIRAPADWSNCHDPLYRDVGLSWVHVYLLSGLGGKYRWTIISRIHVCCWQETNRRVFGHQMCHYISKLRLPGDPGNIDFIPDLPKPSVPRESEVATGHQFLLLNYTNGHRQVHSLSDNPGFEMGCKTIALQRKSKSSGAWELNRSRAQVEVPLISIDHYDYQLKL